MEFGHGVFDSGRSGGACRHIARIDGDKQADYKGLPYNRGSLFFIFRRPLS